MCDMGRKEIMATLRKSGVGAVTQSNFGDEGVSAGAKNPWANTPAETFFCMNEIREKRNKQHSLINY
jgi:hypothetical protein